MDYTVPGFDPNTLRVVDLKRVLGENNISWPSRHRKSDLVEIFTYELIPKLKRQKRMGDKQRRIESAQKKHETGQGFVEAEEVDKERVNKEKVTKSKDTKEKEATAKKADIEKSKPIDVLSVKKRDSKAANGTDKKRKHSQLVNQNEFQSGNDTALYDDYSELLHRKVKRKRNFSRPVAGEKRKNAQQDKESNSKRTLVSQGDDSTVKPETEPVENAEQPSGVNLFNRSGEIKFALPAVSSPKLEEHENINQMANSTFNNHINSNIFDNISESNDDEDNTVLIKKEPQSSLLTPPHVKVEKNILSGPTKDITLPATEEDHAQKKKEVEEDIRVKLEKIETLRTEIRDELKGAGKDASQTQISSSNDLKILDSLPSQNSSTNFTFDSDSELLTQLQNEFELENSRIEIESEKVLNMINSREKFKYYKAQFIKIIVIWLALLLFSFILAIYRQERIQVGFCGCGTESNISLLFKLFNIRLKCVECPDHGVCYPYSQLSCLPEYIMSQPLFWSFWGLIPTYNTCVLDSTKVKKINKIVKSVLDLLSRRNANIKCGDGLDREAGLSWKQIVETIDQRLANDFNDKNYAYIWEKVKIMLTTRTDLKFVPDDKEKNKVIIRSLSLSRLSIKCRLKRLLITLLVKYKVYLLSVMTILLTLSWIFYQINQALSRNEYYRNMVKEIINKLQKQATDNRHSGVAKPYIAKIQLRDYYLPQLQKLTKKNRDSVWKRVVKNIEANSNIKTEDVEINGDIMRVWSWCSDI